MHTRWPHRVLFNIPSLYQFLISNRKEMFYLTMHSTHFIYGYMVSDIWLRTILIVRKETCRHIGYSFRLAARVLLYAPSHRQDSTYHILCYTSHGALAGTRIYIKHLTLALTKAITKSDNLEYFFKKIK